MKFIKLVLIYFFAFSNIQGISAELKFQHFTTRDGLSNSNIFSIVQDHQGFIWIGTDDGLNRFDSNGFKVYKKELNNSNSIVHNIVFTLYVDKHGNLWTGTQRGISKYNPEFDNFDNYLLVKDDIHSNIANCVNAFVEDKDGNFYTCSEDGYLYIFDPAINEFNRIPDIRFGYIKTMFIDSKDRIWIGDNNGCLIYDRFLKTVEKIDLGTGFTHNRQFFIQTICQIGEEYWIGAYTSGIYIYNEDTKQVKHITFNIFKENAIFDILNDGNKVWVATSGGLKIYTPDTEEFQTFKHDELDPESISRDAVTCIFKCRQGIYWFGCAKGGMDQLVESKKFILYQQNTNNPLGLTKSIVSAISEDSNGNLWVGFFTDGIDIINREKKTLVHYEPNPEDPYSIGNSSVFAFYKDEFDNMWVGSYIGGLQKYDEKNKRFITYKHIPDDPESISGNDIRSITGDNRYIWTANGGAGISRFDLQTGKFFHYRANYEEPANSLIDDYPFMVYMDSEKNIWTATPIGLSKLKNDYQSFENFQNNPQDINSIGNDFINYIFEDSEKRIWIGTIDGLNLFNKKNRTFKRYNVSDGLPNSNINGILEDHIGNLWISTNEGLCKFNPITEKFRNYDVNDGLPSNEFLLRSCFKSAKGELFFGGINGLTAFFPDSIKDNNYIPPVVITDIKLYNESININKLVKPRLENKEFPRVKTCKFSYKDKVIGFDFVALNYICPEKNQFAYMLNGFDKNWIYAGTKREATFTNLNPGKYTFKVIASNNDGVWNYEGASVHLTITPPFWATLWFRFTTLLALLGIIVVIIRLRTANIKNRNTQLESINKKLLSEIKIRKEIEKDLKVKNSAVASSIEAIFMSDLHGNLSYVNDSFLELFGIEKANDIYGISFRKFIQSDQEIQNILDILKSGRGWIGEITAIGTENKIINIQISANSVLDENGQPICYMGSLIDITERIHSQKRLKDSLREKEILLREIHHRVKNNLQIIRSLLNLQSKHLTDPKAITAFDDTNKRIYSMALVHERLYQSENFDSINFKEYIQNMIKELFYSYEITGKIKLELNVENISLSLDNAIPSGLLINELVTNALKHAFPDNRKGIVRIFLGRDPHQNIVIKVKDDGIGFDKNFNLDNPQTLGLTLITILTRQLEGELEINIDNGAEFIITF